MLIFEAPEIRSFDGVGILGICGAGDCTTGTCGSGSCKNGICKPEGSCTCGILTT